MFLTLSNFKSDINVLLLSAQYQEAHDGALSPDWWCDPWSLGSSGVSPHYRCLCTFVIDKQSVRIFQNYDHLVSYNLLPNGVLNPWMPLGLNYLLHWWLQNNDFFNPIDSFHICYLNCSRSFPYSTQPPTCYLSNLSPAFLIADHFLLLQTSSSLDFPDATP